MTSEIKLVVGLGNPGPKYANTPHNVGFRVIEELQKLPPYRKVELKKSEGFMNNSGESIHDYARQYHCDPTEILIVCDDIDLPPGQPRLRLSGSSGGHNGLKSIFSAFGGREDIPRLRLGVGLPESVDPAEHVLKTVQDFEQFTNTVLRGAAAVRMAVDEGFETAMNRFNVKVS